MDDFNKNISAAKDMTSSATRFIVKQFIDMNASVLATSGAAGSIAAEPGKGCARRMLLRKRLTVSWPLSLSGHVEDCRHFHYRK